MSTTDSFTYSYDRGRRVEVLCTWYLRFHGYLTTPHFILQRLDGTQYTEADILGVRFPFYAEHVVTGGPDPDLDVRDDLIDCVIAECSARAFKLNEPWKDDFRQNLEYVLSYIGIWPRAQTRQLCEEVEKSSRFAYEWTQGSERYRVRFVFFAAGAYPDNLRDSTRLNLVGILKYLSDRFRCLSSQDLLVFSSHAQWDPFIKQLYNRLMDEPHRREVGDDNTWIRGVLDWILTRDDPA